MTAAAVRRAINIAPPPPAILLLIALAKARRKLPPVAIMPKPQALMWLNAILNPIRFFVRAWVRVAIVTPITIIAVLRERLIAALAPAMTLAPAMSAAVRQLLVALIVGIVVRPTMVVAHLYLLVAPVIHLKLVVVVERVMSAVAPQPILVKVLVILAVLPTMAVVRLCLAVPVIHQILAVAGE